MCIPNYHIIDRMLMLFYLYYPSDPFPLVRVMNHIVLSMSYTNHLYLFHIKFLFVDLSGKIKNKWAFLVSKSGSFWYPYKVGLLVWAFLVLGLSDPVPHAHI